MPRKHDKPEDIVMKLRQVEVLNSQGIVIAQAAREIGATEQAYYRGGKSGCNKNPTEAVAELGIL
jgi:hypothetical protein